MSSFEKKMVISDRRLYELLDMVKPGGRERVEEYMLGRYETIINDTYKRLYLKHDLRLEKVKGLTEEDFKFLAGAADMLTSKDPYPRLGALLLVMAV